MVDPFDPNPRSASKDGSRDQNLVDLDDDDNFEVKRGKVAACYYVTQPTQST